MSQLIPLVVLTIGEQRYALHLSAVDRVVQAVEITPLPVAPPSVLGIINVHGRLLPVLNLRYRFHLADRDLDVDDQFILAHTARRKVVLVVDRVLNIVEIPAQEIVSPEQIFPALEQIEGVVKLADGLVLIHDLDTFLSHEEEQALDSALETI